MSNKYLILLVISWIEPGIKGRIFPLFSAAIVRTMSDLPEDLPSGSPDSMVAVTNVPSPVHAGDLPTNCLIRYPNMFL